MNQNQWIKKLEEAKRLRRETDSSRRKAKRIIADVHDKGGYSYAEIAEVLKISRLQVINIVRQVREEREGS